MRPRSNNEIPCKNKFDVHIFLVCGRRKKDHIQKLGEPGNLVLPSKESQRMKTRITIQNLDLHVRITYKGVSPFSLVQKGHQSIVSFGERSKKRAQWMDLPIHKVSIAPISSLILAPPLKSPPQNMQCPFGLQSCEACRIFEFQTFINRECLCLPHSRKHSPQAHGR